ncbi:NAD(P)/FAD-dependent oxidoreductase [Aeromicrobium sp. Leaf350]|uniref:phytoene desaturase family protein n=1 Tax=Aeromicrobium sp. Leaf350 TaxID=2876565 RepID=UPI001E39E01E|nr:NAD(P)/FAD-dependent oxidoreductase [Aeromicrobium sp. Leaf350]
MTQHRDVVIVGGGHNALVAATLLARTGLSVTVLERLEHVGGAAVSAQAFPEHDARLSRYSYLVSLFPDRLVAELGLRLELRTRDVASYTPYRRADGTADGLLIADGPVETDASFERLVGGSEDLSAWTCFYGDVDWFADVVEPTLLGPLPRASELRERIDPVTWDDLVERPLGEAIERRFSNDLVRGVVATDALIGTFASLHDPSLVQNRCFVYHLIGNGTGEWRVPVGGMGAVTSELERVAREAGAEIVTGTTVDAVEPDDDGVTVRAGDRTWRAAHVLSGVAPAVLGDLVGTPTPTRPEGAQLKVNLLLSRLPRLASGIDPAVAFAGTLHLGEAFSELEAAHAEAASGRLPTRAAGEVYCHTLSDRSILGPELAATEAQTLTYFGLHTPPATLPDAAAAEEAYARVLAALDEHLAEPIAPLVLGAEVKTPNDIEDALAMPGGHIFHGDLAWPWLDDDEPADTAAQRWGVATAHPRVLVCGSGARRGGAVSGLGGHGAAAALLEHLGRGSLDLS